MKSARGRMSCKRGKFHIILVVRTGRDSPAASAPPAVCLPLLCAPLMMCVILLPRVSLLPRASPCGVKAELKNEFFLSFDWKNVVFELFLKD